MFEKAWKVVKVKPALMPPLLSKSFSRLSYAFSNDEEAFVSRARAARLRLLLVSRRLLAFPRRAVSTFLLSLVATWGVVGGPLRGVPGTQQRSPRPRPSPALPSPVTAPCMFLEGPAQGDILGELSAPSSGQRPRGHLGGSRALRDLPWVRPEGAFGASSWEAPRVAGEFCPPG